MTTTINLNTRVIDHAADWEEFKKWIDGTYANLLHTWTEDEYAYLIFAMDGNFVRSCGINKDAGANQIDFETSWKSFKQVSQKIQINNKALLVATAGREGSETIWASHNFCDRTSWFGDSVRTTEVLSGSGYVFSSSYVNWIDMDHGKVLDEDGIKEDVEHGYNIEVIAAGVPKTAREPFTTSGGDYTINYRSGSITFLNNSYNANEVTASFSYEGGSTFYLKPDSGKALDIEEAEAQFSKDIVLTDTIVFGVFGNVEVFAPQYWQGNGGPFPTGYKVELLRQQYKNVSQLVDEALGSYPVIPPIGGAERGFSNEIYGFPFRYGTIRTIRDSYGLQIRCWLKNHNVLQGERVTVTFYCTSKLESTLD